MRKRPTGLLKGTRAPPTGSNQQPSREGILPLAPERLTGGDDTPFAGPSGRPRQGIFPRLACPRLPGLLASPFVSLVHPQGVDMFVDNHRGTAVVPSARWRGGHHDPATGHDPDRRKGCGTGE